MKVIDAFVANDEYAILELRLLELYDVVDHFYVVEAPVTFVGDPKPMYMKENWGKFERWHDKMTLYSAQDCPVGKHPTVENWQRRKLFGAWGIADPGDIVLMGDVDEIPNRDAITQLKREWPADSGAIALKMNLLYAGPRWLAAVPWLGSVAIKAIHNENGPVVPDCQRLRDMRINMPRLENSGWHVSWWGGESSVSDKIRSLAVEDDIRISGMSGKMVAPSPDDREKIRAFVRDGADLFGRDRFAREIPIGPGTTHPHDIVEWLTRHPEMDT